MRARARRGMTETIECKQYEDHITTGCSGRSAARPAAEPARYAPQMRIVTACRLKFEN